MDAIVSGSAGLAILVEEDGLWSIRPGAPGAVDAGRVARVPHEIRYLLGDARDLCFLEAVTESAVREELCLARGGVQGLHLALMLCDPETSDGAVELAVREIDGLLVGFRVTERIERILEAKPMPTAFDLAGAAARCERRGCSHAASFFAALAERQPVIREVRAAWDVLPRSLFESPEDRAVADGVLAREGLFRSLVRARSSGAGVEHWLAAALRNTAVVRIRGHEGWIAAWVQPFRPLIDRLRGQSSKARSVELPEDVLERIARVSARFVAPEDHVAVVEAAVARVVREPAIPTVERIAHAVLRAATLCQLRHWTAKINVSPTEVALELARAARRAASLVGHERSIFFAVCALDDVAFKEEVPLVVPGGALALGMLTRAANHSLVRTWRRICEGGPLAKWSKHWRSGHRLVCGPPSFELWEAGRAYLDTIVGHFQDGLGRLDAGAERSGAERVDERLRAAAAGASESIIARAAFRDLLEGSIPENVRELAEPSSEDIWEIYVTPERNRRALWRGAPKRDAG